MSYRYEYFKDYDREDLIDIIIKQDAFIDDLRDQLKMISERTNKEFEENRKLTTEILTVLAEVMINES